MLRFALKQWPESMTAERLAGIHAWMAQAESLPFVPHVLRTNDGRTLHVEAGRAWDLTTWMKGMPSPKREQGSHVAAAPSALAELHRVWRPTTPRLGPAPAIVRRLAALDDPHPFPPDLNRFVEAAKAALRPWLNHRLPLQPCLCDVHREHILFADELVTGVIDYGAMKEDHVSVDLARWLGDVCGEDDSLFEAGLAAYRGAGGVLDVPSTFSRLLDRTGLVCALLGWERRSKHHPAAVQRVQELRKRLASLRGI